MKTRFRLAASAGISHWSARRLHAGQERVREIDWAKAALARNPAYEILATDESAGVFTVRDTATGAVRTLRLEDLVAARMPPQDAAQPRRPRRAAPAAEPSEPADARRGRRQRWSPVKLPRQVQGVRAGPGMPLAEGPGYSITRGERRQTPAASEDLEGPGYSITRDEPAKQRQQRRRAPKPWPRTSNAAPIPSSARAIA